MLSKKAVPRVCAIHDLSCFGRCSLAVITPVLSVMGVQVCPLPTAVLSTHTGGFGKPAKRELTQQMRDQIKHWKSINLSFDCIYSGYAASARQIDIMANVIDEFGAQSLVVVDPVMGDGGNLYSSISMDMVAKMRELVKKAHIITPNITEAFLLLGMEYKPNFSKGELQSMVRKLTDMGPRVAIITSVKKYASNDGAQSGDQVGAIAFERDCGTFHECYTSLVSEVYPGTGDIYTSVLIGALMRGDKLPVAMDVAAKFVLAAMTDTVAQGTKQAEGVLIERSLGLLL